MYRIFPKTGRSAHPYAHSARSEELVCMVKQTRHVHVLMHFGNIS